MPKLNTTVKAVRVDNDKLAELERRLNGQTINSWLNEQIDAFLEGKRGLDGVPKGIMDNIILMSQFCDGGLAGLMSAVNGMLEDGVLDTDLSIHRDEWIEDFEKFSKENGMSLRKATDKAIKLLRKEICQMKKQ